MNTSRGPYKPQQAREILDHFWPKGVEWFVVGGTSDALEGQVVKAKHPNVECIGFVGHYGLRIFIMLICN